ncbi:dynein axonemal intermediate chain 4 isoform X1 [Ictalurus punctatus]|uniref:Dynein axonemal intermediate chain 4 n=2 Tax=Ictalurus punctatus TaxID=7998 RepID=A0A2D0RX83_ICTPU|nr:dynein axonemal intermediate chain 4 isoform X1 [Ictalurus punctatus]
MSNTTAKQVRPTAKVTRSSRVMNQSGSGTLRINRSSTNRRIVNASVSRRSFSLARDSKVLDKGSVQTPKHTVQVFDETGKDVTPQPLYQLEPGATQTKQSKIFPGHDTSEGTVSDILSTVYHTMSASSAGPFTMSVFGSTLVSSHSAMESVSDEIEEISAKQETVISLSELKIKSEEQIKEPLLDNPVDIYLTETEIMCFLDIPAVSVSVDAKEAEAVTKRNKAYAEICKSRQGNDKYVEREMQTINAASKSKEVQSDRIIMVEKGSMATSWDIYDLSVSSSRAEDSEGSNTDKEKPSSPDVSSSHHFESNRGLQRTMSRVSATSTVSTASSQRQMEASTAQMVDEPDPEQILPSEKFQQSLQVMERMVLLNIYQHKLAAYRGLSILPDPDHVEDMVADKEENSLNPALELLWTFSCEPTKGHSVTSMAWNKKNPDILAVGYGRVDFKDQKSGLVCVWSLKNPTWPERIFNCKTSVTSLDFSASNPSQLAVGLYDGIIAIYNVQGAKAALVCDNRNCSQKHTAPVWQVRWINRIQSPSGEDKRETLFSVSADARISEWFLHQGFDCTDILKLKRIRNEKMEQDWRHEPFISRWAVGLCFDFHPHDSNMYLVGTEEGHIHECSCSYNEQFLETYTNHLGPVYKVTWSPFCPDLFLSCSADWTIQLWSQDHFTPVLSFTSIKEAVYDIMWSPRWATVFGVVNKDRVEIWDLGASILNPTLVSEAIPGMNPTSLLFAMKTDCVLVGDSEGQVSVYKLKNFTAGEATEVDTLNNIVSSTLARQH